MSRKLTLILSAGLVTVFVLCVLLFRMSFFSGEAVQTIFNVKDPELILTGGDDGEQAATELLPGELIDINTASAEQMRLLPGIGEVLSEEIVAYRLENGSFECVEDIMKVKGIGEGKFSDIAEHIAVNGGIDENPGS